ncbi:hypothetical protein OSJ77_19900 [Phyllobacterium sp. 0TCS1.6C]|uniref:hypothetical protein n=1 Tax=unclassified Phyllobacterium TaxID=2638441 RepID=UPI002265165C|nr:MULTISPECIES: hypothetical protein [unclassified Phyllobacterium]MCX8282458.1 hypothetical protein [Phyllobacterium sp. 0TCS1.6C]MCX8292550.1 hypothetical protein [Phyllobacterium sp. 0TCS1.6A]
MHEMKIPHYVEPFLARIRGGAVLVSQASQSEEATAKGDGHLYFTHPDGRPVGTASAVYCIREGLVVPEGDDLFGGSQTYRAALP